MARQSTKRVNYKGPPPDSALSPPMLASSVNYASKTTNSSSYLIRECDLESSSYEEFVDSGDEVIGRESLEMLTDSNQQPSLESLLNNLTLDKPIIPTSIDTTSVHNLAPSNIRERSFSRKASISWLSSAFKWEPSDENNLVIDSGSTDTKPIILYATKMKLIEKLTTILGTHIEVRRVSNVFF